ncbi:MAG TPA: FkbM family methyltransferase [Acidisarcina sp.]
MVLGREFPVTRLLGKGLTLLRVLPRLVVVKHPVAVLRSYIRQESLEFIDLRSGHRVFLSNHPHDIVTFFVVFIKRGYGEIRKSEVVFDVGANIGLFSIFAALSGAKAVYAFEPSSESFAKLKQNISANGLENIVIPTNKAVTNRGGEVVSFPRSSSPYNSLTGTPAGGDCDQVLTVTLEDFMRDNGIPQIDLLKMDCEGAEFSIVPALTGDMIHRISKIRMECHGSSRVLMDGFRENAYTIERSHGNDLWLRKRAELKPVLH